MASRILHVMGVLALIAACSPCWGQTVKITPLGSHAGELCDRDRATIFEDPTGIRILYDAGQSVTGADDARLGTIDVVLLSHAHGDHIGDQKMKTLEAGTCDSPEVVSAAPNSTTRKSRGQERRHRHDRAIGELYRAEGRDYSGEIHGRLSTQRQ
jgi:glyoxylase-like metal-dependent hydrolase (beta-lactamase superfamily II)